VLPEISRGCHADIGAALCIDYKWIGKQSESGSRTSLSSLCVGLLDDCCAACVAQNTHINDLMRKHERAFAEIKNYYNDITHNNLDLIKALKEDVAEMKKREAQNEKLM